MSRDRTIIRISPAAIHAPWLRSCADMIIEFYLIDFKFNYPKTKLNPALTVVLFFIFRA